MSGESEVAQRQDTLNRYLLYFPRSKNVISDVHSFTGKEILSEPYRYTIRFTSPDLNIAINAVLNQRAEFILRAPNLEASWHGQTSWLPVRQINGTITQFSRLMSSGDEALYECVLEHELALLDQNYRSAVYMNMTVPELVTKLMKDSGHFDGYNIDFDQLSHSYPRREMIVQWKETDLRFIRRLLAEIGIWFRFENHNKVKTETVVIFGDSARRYNFSDKQMPYVRHSGMTSYSEYITDLEEQHGLIPKNVLVRTYNYRDPQSPQTDKTVKTSDIPEGVTTGQHYHYADHYLTAGDFHGEEAETAAFYARLRYERLLNGQSLLGATTSDPELQPGIMFYPSGPVPDGFKSGFVITAMTIRGSRAEHYRAVLSGIPYIQGYSFRPEYLSRPVIAGTVPARVKAIGGDKTYAGLDAVGRYRVKFDFDLDEKRVGFESALVRLGRPYAGDTFGIHFPLLEGTEVAVGFEGGDPDRPFIAHVMHDGSHPDLVTNRNDTRNVIRTAALNKIRLEDRRGQEHIKIATEYGKGQVSVGHLVDAEGKKRGEGVEARTDDWMALRAAKGVMITTEAQPRAGGKQLDMTAAIAQLEKALSLAMTLQQSALTAGASNVETDRQNALSQTLSHLAEPGILAYGKSGIALVTPDNDPKTSDKPYTYYVDPDSPDAYISYSAKASAIKRTVTTTFAVNRYQNIGWQPGHVLSASELKEESFERKHEVIYGEVSGSRDFQLVTLTWKKTPEELQAEWQKIDPVGYSQHSSIVMSEFAPSHAMAFDLAIGQCKSFDYQAGKFWEGLLHRADWRDPQNENPYARAYYRTGKLDEPTTKFFMNKPYDVLPKGEYGVVNKFNNATTVKPSSDLVAGNQDVANLQWDMPKPISDSQLA
ncbi:type VI secretion system tip protein VgrG [Enterobacter hormaechei]|uniref:type VI secretion system tip protein VgrG n=3 Tax=Enterobacter hormaechei TaxID=158836 RepID=UPI00188C60CF|nr:type VI secretion system tip protein VgrG [Enterobacter hormaechei]MBF4151185.1 type VI secretion system tip protein VgrG [Enterobacter hormaechei]